MYHDQCAVGAQITAHSGLTGAEAKVKRFFGDIKKYYRYLFYAARSELHGEVASSYLNWLWWILDPLLFSMVYIFLSGIVFKSREDCFPIFVVIGLTVWNFFNKTVLASIKLVKNNKAVLNKVYIPKFMLILQKMYVNAFKMLISFGIVLVLMIVYRVMPNWRIIYLPVLILIIFLITFGCSTIVMHTGVFVNDLSNLMTVFLRLMFYLTGVFYSLEDRVPGVLGKLMNRLNPVAFVISCTRKALLYGGHMSWKYMLCWILAGFFLSVFGIRLIYKNENNYIKVV